MQIPPLTRWRNEVHPFPHNPNGPGELVMGGMISKSRGLGEMRVFGQWALVYLVAGSGRYRDERGMDKMVSPGDVILVFPEIAHRYGPEPGEEWSEIYFVFAGPVFETWRAAGCFDADHPVRRWLPVRDGLRRLRRFTAELGRGPSSGLRAMAVWQELLAEIFSSSERPPDEPGWLSGARHLLEQPGTTPQKVARACGMGYESFRKKFGAATGVPPARYATRCRVEAARRLLRMDRFTHKEIAEMLGFYDEFHFSRVFTRFGGKSPRAWQRGEA